MNRNHYKNEWFVNQLVNASAKRTLEEAAPEWEFSHFGYLDKRGNCQICHTHIARFVAIKNRSNGVVLLIGEDCYDKLQYYLATQKLEAVNLQSRKQYISQIKKYCKREINAAFLEWFNGRGEIPDGIKNTLKVIKQLGYAPSIAAAEEVVEYYKNHRLFTAEELLGEIWMGAKEGVPWSSIPQHITLAQLPGFQKLVGDWEKAWWGTLQKAVWKRAIERSPFKVEGVQWRGNYDVQVELSFRRRKFGITIPVSSLEKRLGRGMEWPEYEEDYLMAFRRTMPQKIRLEVVRPFQDTIIFQGDDLMNWCREARKVIQLEERRKNAISLAFERGWNPKHHIPQWEAQLDGVKYVLRKEDNYDPPEGQIKVAKVFDLVPDRVVLVERV